MAPIHTILLLPTSQMYWVIKNSARHFICGIMNVHNSDLAHRLFNGLSDGLSPSVIDSRFHGIYYFPDLIEKPPEKVDALTDLMTRENERMGKMIKKENRMAQARRNRDKQVANEFSLKQQQLDSNRKRVST